LQDRPSTSPNPAMDAVVFINLRECLEVYNWRKWDIQKLHRTKNQWVWRPCKELWRKHLALRILKFQDRFHHRSKTDVTLLFEVRFEQIKTRSKENFVNYAMEYILGILSVLDIKENFMEWRQHWRVINKEIAMKQKGALGKSSISDQAQHGK
jgi:hypothetical protein